jgi:hypothetical protein
MLMLWEKGKKWRHNFDFLAPNRYRLQRSSSRSEKCQNIRTDVHFAIHVPRDRASFIVRVVASDVFSCPLAFFKGATIILYQHNNREQYGIGKIVATRVFALLFARPYPHCLRQKVFFLKKNQWNKQEKLQKRLYSPAFWYIFCDFSATRRKIAESQNRAVFARSMYQRWYQRWCQRW